MPEVDLQQLAIDRDARRAPPTRIRRHVLTRYVIPGVLIVGFLALIAGAARDLVFPPRDVTVVPVRSVAVEVHQQGTPLFQAAGWIEPRPTTVRVAALAPGVVEQLLVVEDQAVDEGDAIAELVKDDARLGYESALADRQLREAELEEARALLMAAQTRFEQPVHLEADLAQADAALAKTETQLTNLPFETRRAQAHLKFAERDYKRKVSARTAISERDVDESESELTTAKAMFEELLGRKRSLEYEQTALTLRRDALRTQLQLLVDEIKARDEAAAQVKAAQARLDQTSVAVAEAKLRLERMTIRAPMDGRVYKLIGHPGARIGDGNMAQMQGHDPSTVVTMYQPHSLQVRVDVRFEDIPQVSLAQPVRIENAASAAPLAGEVLFISSLADIQKNTLEVKVALHDPPAVFKPEMLVDVTFLAPAVDADAEASSEMRLYVSPSLVRQDTAGEFVWLADQSAGLARRTSVTTGVVRDGLIEIAAGLTVSSRLIASATDGLQDGDRIRVTGEAPVSETSNP